MKRVLVTGMSGTGKSAVIRELAARGHAAVDLDDAAWSAWVDADGDPTGALPGKDWLWREDRVGDLLAADGAGMLFVSGCASNMGPFLGRLTERAGRGPARCLRPWRWQPLRARMVAGPGADAAEPEETACPRSA